MLKKLLCFVVSVIVMTFVLCRDNAMAQEPIAAQEFIETLQNLIAATIKNTEHVGRITKVEIHIGVTYTKDHEGKLKILAMPQEAISPTATVHKLTLHWIPQGPVQGQRIEVPGPLPMLPPTPGLSAKQREILMEILQQKAKSLSEKPDKEEQKEEQKKP